MNNIKIVTKNHRYQPYKAYFFFILFKFGAEILIFPGKFLPSRSLKFIK